MIANTSGQAQFSFGVEGCFDFQQNNSRKDPNCIVPPFQIEENESLFERGFEHDNNQKKKDKDDEEQKGNGLKLNFNKITETNHKQDSDGSSSPFNK